MADDIFCPKCHRPMVKRTSKSNGRTFYGCPAFFPYDARRNPEGYDESKGETQCNGMVWPKAKKKEPIVKQPLPTFKGSPQQQAIWREMEHGTSHLMIEALPGTGKTTTIVMGAAKLKGTTCAFAFSKKIETELQTRMPGNVTVATFHSFGKGICERNLPKKPILLNAPGAKTYKIIDDGQLLPQGLKDEEQFMVKRAIHGLISLCKNRLVDPDEPGILEELADRYDINVNGNAETVFRLVPGVLRCHLAMRNYIDFDDMQWFPIMLKLAFPKFDNVMVDECQDTNAVRTAMIFRAAGENGRIIAVGDENQSIMGFSGSDTEAIESLRDQLQVF